MSRREHWLWKEEALANPGQRERTGTKVDKENSDSPLAVARGVLRRRDVARRSKAAVVVEDEVKLDQEGKEDSYRDVVVVILRL